MSKQSDFTYTEKALAKLTIKQLAEAHNAIAPTSDQVKRFATKEGGIKRILKLVAAQKDKPAKAPRTTSGLGQAKAIAESWNDKGTREARTARHHCKVKGETYTSVRKAFAALGLPDSKHQRLRKELVAEGKATFTDEDGTKYQFTLVSPE